MPRSTDHVSLLRTEAVDRAAALDVRSTTVELDLREDGDFFTSVTTIEFGCRTPGVETFVDFKGAELQRATLNGEPLDLDTWRQGRLPLRVDQSANTLVVTGRMAYSSDGEGLHRHVDPADQQTYLYAMSFLDAGPRWFACFDQPDLKSPYVLEVRAPEHWTVIGNGPSENLEPGRWRIASTQPLSTYYVTLVAGPYASVYAEHDGIPLGFHVRASLGEFLQAEAEDLIAVTKASFDYYHRVFGVRYPFGEYHQAFVPDFNAGAMENPGCVTFRDQFIFRAKATASERASRAGTIAHEMAHQWFGDLVTMTWWDDLWLNESFAEYMAHRCCSEATAYPLWTEFGIVRKDWGSVADQSPSTHPVAGNGSADAQSALQDFDGISYAKGAAVLKQLVAYLGDEVFLAGLRDYFDRHAFGNAEFADLIAAWTRAGAEDLEHWAGQWLRTSGMDRLDVERRPGEVAVTRTPPAGSDADRTHALVVAGFDADGRVLSRTETTLAGEPVRMPVGDDVVTVVPDAEDQTWATVRFGDDGWPGVAALLRVLGEHPSRVVALNAIRDAVRAAELDPAAALDMICGAVVVESSDVVLRSVLQFALDHLAGPFSPPELRLERRAQLQQSARGLLDAAEPASDRQLAAFRLTIRSCDDPSVLARWLDGAGLPAGVALDPELTWALVTRLAGCTGDSAVIERALADDPSASAHVHAARARAGLPSAEAKEAAWALLMQPTSTGAYELYATAEGFFAPTQTELTAAYVPRYFAEIAATAEFRSGWALGQVAMLAYPTSASTPQTLALAEETLSRTDLPSPVRRSIIDGTDRLRRAIASRQRFTG